MSVTLSPEVQSRVLSWVGRGRYSDANAVVLDALQLLEERNQEQFLKLREMVRAGFESGDELELTPELWNDLVREAEEEERQGLPIRDEVRP
jgi:putative addiction module CopG family antidote